MTTQATEKPPATVIAEILPAEAPTFLALKEKAEALIINSDEAELAAMLVIDENKAAEKRLEEERKGQTDPLRDRIEIITAPYRTAISFYAEVRLRLEGMVKTYRADKQERARLEQQRILDEKAEADRKARAEAAKKDEEARKAREKLEAEQRELTAKEKARLDKLDAEAQRAREAAAAQEAKPVEIVKEQPKTVTLASGRTMTAKAKVSWKWANGTPRGTTFYGGDARFPKLPIGCFEIKEAKVTALVNSGMSRTDLLAMGILVYDDTTLASGKEKA